GKVGDDTKARREENGGHNKSFNWIVSHCCSHICHGFPFNYHGSIHGSGCCPHQQRDNNRPSDGICVNAAGFGVDIPHSLTSDILPYHHPLQKERKKNTSEFH
ncbi:unnamed protein product, partial [Ilex paraguariensis]